MRGLDYRSIEDFDLGVRYMQMLGVRYYMAYSTEAKSNADANPDLRQVAELKDHDGVPPSGWKVYEVEDFATVAPLEFEPIVVTPHAGTQAECFGRAPVTGERTAELGPWECMAAGWWNDPNALDRPLAAGGPASWKRVPASKTKSAPKTSLPKVTVTDIHQTDSSVSFHVSRTGVPVVVRTSYYPNWQASGADGPWRLTPNFMVVVPTSKTVTLNYARSGPEIVGIALSVFGVVGLGGLIFWRPRDPDDEPADPGPDETPGAGPPERADDWSETGAEVPSGTAGPEPAGVAGEEPQVPGVV